MPEARPSDGHPGGAASCITCLKIPLTITVLDFKEYIMIRSDIMPLIGVGTGVKDLKV